MFLEHCPQITALIAHIIIIVVIIIICKRILFSAVNLITLRCLTILTVLGKRPLKKIWAQMGGHIQWTEVKWLRSPRARLGSS
jgi:hypothetical protein